MKKHLALLLIAIMAVSLVSAAGVVTTQKVAARDVGSITYSKGATFSYTPKQFNYDWKVLVPEVGTPRLSATASGGTASASANATSTQNGYGWATVGMDWHLSLPTTGQYSTWNNVKNMPCTVTVTLTSYTLKSSGPNAIASAGWGPWLRNSRGIGTYLYSAKVVGTSSARHPTATYTWHGTVGKLFSANDLFAIAGGSVSAGVIGPVRAAGQASGTLGISSVVLQF